MKFLVLNPNLDAERKITQLLKSAGVAVISTPNVEEAWQALQLHGTSVDFALIHREGGNGSGEPGLELVKKIKTDQEQKDLPFILTTEKWSDAECATHQASPFGANGYVRLPIDDQTLRTLIEAVLGVSLTNPTEFTSGTGLTAKTAIPPVPTSTKIPQPTQTVGIETAQVPFQPQQAAPLAVDPGNITSATLSDIEASQPIALQAPESLVDPAAAPTSKGFTASIQLQALDDQSKAFEEFEASASVPLQTAGALTGESSAIPVLASPEEDRDKTTKLRIEAPASVELSGSIGLNDGSVGAISLSSAFPDLSSAPSGGAQTEGSKSLKINPSSKTDPVVPAPTADTTAPVAATADPAQADDPEAIKQMQYLFGKNLAEKPITADVLAGLSQPVGDAVVPGGAFQTPDLETLKKYLLLREQDVAALSGQLKSSREQIKALEDQVKVEKARSGELEHMMEQQKIRIAQFDAEKRQLSDSLESEINELRFQVRAKGDKALSLESQVKVAAEEIESIKKRVRLDIRKIRVREKELENKLEILKKDSEALITARESKIIELKRKLDMLEFNMDLLQEQYAREKDHNAELKERMAKIAQAMKIAGGLLGSEEAKQVLGTAAAETETGEEKAAS